MTKDTKIAVYGAGAMGTVLGALLTKGGLENVTLITRNKAHVHGLKTQGATILCRADNTQFTIPVYALTPQEMVERGEKYDVVFLMTKQRNNAEILQTLLPHYTKIPWYAPPKTAYPNPRLQKSSGWNALTARQPRSVQRSLERARWN